MRTYLLIPGILVSLAGLIFTLQGEGIVGPPSSFMYQSTAWIENGVAVLAVGLLLIVAGLWRRKRTAAS